MTKVVIDEHRCKGCALCTLGCPQGLLRLSRTLNRAGFFPAEMIPGGEEKCTSCALCAQMCPDLAICVFRRKKSA
ncbi:4Fe-4S dicluster domain-containing protein [Geoalkalibacter sp.]|uniref:4Fe-4S dicluster domain-containing protein n=1 Tax=Geoalkalibacter sp. TaxID=3041440 RepID=UPI00272E15ED|nr:4Fe-4S dicluster domain-containing protein [Geoalkalibacter sp.]